MALRGKMLVIVNAADPFSAWQTGMELGLASGLFRSSEDADRMTARCGNPARLHTGDARADHRDTLWLRRRCGSPVCLVVQADPGIIVAL